MYPAIRSSFSEDHSLAVQGLEKMAGVRSIIGVKRMGELDQKTFYNACKNKMPNDKLKLALVCSKWEDEITKPEWHPFKVIETAGQIKVCIPIIVPYNYAFVYVF